MALQGMAWEAHCGADIRHLLYTLEQLPMDKAQAASNVQPLLKLSTTRFAGVVSQSMASEQSTSTGSPKSLHRSFTDVDAERRQRQGAVSASGHAHSNGTAQPHDQQGPVQEPQQHAASQESNGSEQQQATATAAASEMESLEAEADPMDSASPPRLHPPDGSSQEASMPQSRAHSLSEEPSHQSSVSEETSMTHATNESNETEMLQASAQSLSSDNVDQLKSHTGQEAAKAVLQSAAEEELRSHVDEDVNIATLHETSDAGLVTSEPELDNDAAQAAL